MKKQVGLQASKQGFTLLELSIVLVIIALLLGAVMSARSYVRNAALNSLMNESKFYISAFTQFQTRYNAPPGDFDNAAASWTGAGNGDGNGLIAANGGVANTVESYYAWQHLALAGFIQGNYTGAVNANGGATVIGAGAPAGAVGNVPAAVINPAGYYFDHPSQMDGIVPGAAAGDYPGGVFNNVLRIAGVNGISSSVPNAPFLSSNQLNNLDIKFDDGSANTGNIVAPTGTACNTAAAYAISDAIACAVILNMQ